MPFLPKGLPKKNQPEWSGEKSCMLTRCTSVPQIDIKHYFCFRLLDTVSKTVFVYLKFVIYNYYRHIFQIVVVMIMITILMIRDARIHADLACSLKSVVVLWLNLYVYCKFPF